MVENLFEKIIGNDDIKQKLKKTLMQNTVSHSYLFIGKQGIGKKLIAKEFAKGILEKNSYENNPDLIYVEPDGNSIKIEQIRQIQKEIQEKPILSNKKVCIIDDADKMTKEAQNCLLKTLEEPPSFATIILIGENENEFLSTIKSRCIIIHFNPINDNEMKEYLSKNLNLENITENMLDNFGGSIGKALNLKDKQELYEKIEQIINNLKSRDIIDILNMSEIIYKSKEEIFDILDYINVILLKKSKEDWKYTDCIQVVENTKQKLKQNANYDMCIDNMLFKLSEEV